MVPAIPKSLLKIAFLTVTLPPALYLATLFPSLQTHAFYVHRISLTWGKDLNVPETFGFLPNQAIPFLIHTADGETLHAWHVLPLGAYRCNRRKLLALPQGVARGITTRLSFKALRNDPDARLVICLHGASRTLASSWRPDGYRALSTAAPDNLHILAFDYCGFGHSTGVPSEPGLLTDAFALVTWATQTAGVPPARILIFGQSLGTAVGISLALHCASQTPPVVFAGTVLVASFSDVAALTQTYAIGRLVPVPAPLARAPRALAWFCGFLASTWRSKERIAEFVRLREGAEIGGGGDGGAVRVA